MSCLGGTDRVTDFIDNSLSGGKTAFYAVTATRFSSAKGAGFTLIELLVSVSIMVVVAGIAVPSYQAMINRNLLRSASHAFYTSLVLARSEAVTQNIPVVMCKSADGANCTASGDWHQGWLVFIDVDKNTSLDSGDTLIDQQASLSRPSIISQDPAVHLLVYQVDGTQRNAVTFDLCMDSNAAQGSRIEIGLTGRPTTLAGASSCP